ncbi:MAG: hypothetical protein HQK49_04325 [Oligoflexia bacterium]|nr:hypothetical protein [Oligoflexia bacterium]
MDTTNNIKKQSSKNSVIKNIVGQVTKTSVAVAIISILIVIGLDYLKYRSQLNLRLDEIEKSYLISISDSMWNMANDQVKMQLKGISNLPDIKYVEIVNPEGKVLYFDGDKGNDIKKYIERVAEITKIEGKDKNILGKLHVYATMENAISKILLQAISSFAVIIFLIITLIITNFLAIKKQICVHLEKMATYAQNLDISDPEKNQPLQLDKKIILGSNSNDKNDELDEVCIAINKMLSNIKSSHQEKLKHSLQLEQTVSERTKHIEEEKKRTEDLLLKVRNLIGVVDNSSKNVMDTTQNVSLSSNKQVSSIEEISDVMKEISLHINQNALNSDKARKSSFEMKEKATNGNNQMIELCNSMNEVVISAQNISKIIKVIDEIAFQTNLLALNAAVEAARAGKHGKGFAVVAEEVRNLASRSADSARETKELIDDSLNKIKRSSDISNETSKVFKLIVDGVSSVAELIDAIAKASQEQSMEAEKVGKGLKKVEDISKNNQLVANSTLTAAQELSEQSNGLYKILSA